MSDFGKPPRTQAPPPTGAQTPPKKQKRPAGPGQERWRRALRPETVTPVSGAVAPIDEERLPSEMTEDKISDLMKRADELLQERRSRPPSPNTAAGAAANGGAVSGEGDLVADMVTRVAAIPIPSVAKPTDDPANTLNALPSTEVTRDHQSEVATRIAPMPKPHVLEIESVATTVGPAPLAPVPAPDPDWSPGGAPSRSSARSRFSRLSRWTKWAIAGGGATCAIIMMALIVGVGAPSRPSSVESAPPADAPTKSIHPSSPTTRHAEPARNEGDAAAKGIPAQDPGMSEPGTVLIYLEGVPKWSRVTVNGLPSALPLRLTKSSEMVTVTVKAKGYKRWRRRIVPDRERHLPVRMTPKKK